MKHIKTIDPLMQEIFDREQDRQTRKLNLIAAVSICPKAVREALSSPFVNVDAEGYPPDYLYTQFDEDRLDFEAELERYQLVGDQRPNRNTTWANVVEVLAQTRCGRLYAGNVPSDQIWVNVQPFSGSIANQCAIAAFVEPGQRILAMALTSGGHLSHGSSVHNSSKLYNFKHYAPEFETGMFDWDNLRALVDEFEPHLIIAGASAFPKTIDWSKLHEIAKSLPKPAYLMADIAHTAGLVAGKVFPNPIGIVDVTTLVGYKTLCGARSAAIITTNLKFASWVNRSVFPRTQSSPSIQNIAAMAVSFHLASQPEFSRLQSAIIGNARTLVESFKELNYFIPFGGTDTHLMLLDLRKTPHSTSMLSAQEFVQRADNELDIIMNVNMLPGDKKQDMARGVRIGLTVATQMGIKKGQVVAIANSLDGLIRKMTS